MKKINYLVHDFDNVRKMKEGDVVEVIFKREMNLLGINEDHFFYKIGLDLAQSSFFKNEGGPSYHNSYHAAEAMISATTLLKTEFEDEPEKIKKWGPYLVLGMMAHDLDHSGGKNQSFAELEWKSFNTLQDFIFQKVAEWEVDGHKTNDLMVNHSLDVLKEIIVGTEFSKNAKDNIANYKNSDFDRIKLLANEADILPASLSLTGLERAELLTKEWNDSSVSSFKGYVGFLKFAVNYQSDAAKELGLDKDIQSQITAFDVLGGENLDNMDRNEAKKFFRHESMHQFFRLTFPNIEKSREFSYEGKFNLK